MQNSRSGPVQRGDALAVHEFSLTARFVFEPRACGNGHEEFAVICVATRDLAFDGGSGAAGSRQLIL
jgi:hypothetical protein